LLLRSPADSIESLANDLHIVRLPRSEVERQPAGGVDEKDGPHGLAIKEALEDYYEKEIHHGRLYPNLDTLVEKGLIERSQLSIPVARMELLNVSRSTVRNCDSVVLLDVTATTALSR